MPRGMNIVDLKKALNCRSHSSAVKEKAFVGKELDKKLWVVRVAILLLEYIKHLQRIWLSPLLDIPQAGIQSRIVYDFLGAERMRKYKKSQ